MLSRKCQIDGLVIEGPLAGGHNAPPRGKTQLSASGEPVYNTRDTADPAAIAKLGLPFWLAGSYGHPDRLQDALKAGANGVQVGTLFAFCEESGLREDLKRQALNQCREGTAQVFTDPVASPTGFPFKVLALDGTLSDTDTYHERARQCDLGYLREAYERPSGAIGWRCPAEEPEVYLKKGGCSDSAVGRKCLCNSLAANAGLAQLRPEEGEELPLLTCGSDLGSIPLLLGSDQTSYSAADVIRFLLASSMAA